ncbi:hypothetical protein Rmet_6497 [Cupriavidus metallidurans CH34]|uniref:Uncharacterized protein n=1 Tax=Cupriavidus metallidurans (strain ATCC 43123 / DSM 2839 / NBRC 102507 / CH34) TaxID=266264 RepID=D3DXT5_CUPMC|nr:hypothetical protein Rmet_6497 [Cupriavidus metallidurans CH34]
MKAVLIDTLSRGTLTPLDIPVRRPSNKRRLFFYQARLIGIIRYRPIILFPPDRYGTLSPHARRSAVSEKHLHRYGDKKRARSADSQFAISMP